VKDSESGTGVLLADGAGVVTWRVGINVGVNVKVGAGRVKVGEGGMGVIVDDGITELTGFGAPIRHPRIRKRKKIIIKKRRMGIL
jgi:hypothetical protein